MRTRTGIRIELGWLLAFLAIFAALAFVLLKYVVPHHFNDRIAVLLAALGAGLVWIGLRAAVSRRSQ